MLTGKSRSDERRPEGPTENPGRGWNFLQSWGMGVLGKVRRKNF